MSRTGVRPLRPRTVRVKPPRYARGPCLNCQEEPVARRPLSGLALSAGPAKFPSPGR